MASIFNPPNGADLLVADADPFKSDFSALENAVQVDIQRGAKRGAVSAVPLLFYFFTSRDLR